MKPEILIVDDSEDICEILSTILQTLGFPSRYFLTTPEAILYFEVELNPIVFLDIHIGNKNGLELLPEFKRINPECQVIMITGEKDANSIIQSIKNQASDFILKPFSVDTVESSIHKSLEYFNLLKEKNNYREALEREIRFGTRVQRQIVFPKKNETNAYIDFLPVSQVSGNFYHILELNDQKKILIYGNVEGSGVASGFVGLFVISFIKDIARVESKTSRILEELNKELYFKLNIHTVTIFVAIIDSEEKRINFSMGGVPDPILVTQKSSELEFLKSESLQILGIVPNLEFKDHYQNFEAKDILFLFNQGFFDSQQEELKEKFDELKRDFFEIKQSKGVEFSEYKTRLDKFFKTIQTKSLQRKDISFILISL
ncbi:MAG: response regulator [Leptospiraceae bacterium]|nr:response regulator [Leptospiraceae bacterium]